MTRLVIINNGSGNLQVGKDDLFFNVTSSLLADNIHALQWYETHGEVEYKDPASGRMTHNVEIDSIADFQFAIDAWNAAKAAEDAAIALQEAKNAAYASAYDAAIANGDSEEDAVAAGQAASDAVTSL